ncbi:hypothetical protein [Vibrio intestinalis]|uniref:hypothetical protein n=1 Tax=Vibrio intestinalis TaxID=2933291 RepID=UPI0021A47A84|nr:hypothetical protein [Vibrio intestinalis]
MYRTLVLLLVLNLSGCASEYALEQAQQDDFASITLNAEAEGTMTGTSVRFFHVDQSGQCDIRGISGYKQVMHKIGIGGWAEWKYDAEEKTVPIAAGEPIKLMVAANSGGMGCTMLSEFVPEQGSDYQLNFVSKMSKSGSPECSLELLDGVSKLKPGLDGFKSETCSIDK